MPYDAPALFTRVQRRLRDLVAAGPFYPVTYDPATDLAVFGAAPEPVASLAFHNVNATFDDALRFRRHGARERRTWTWLVIATFNCEVTPVAFEEQVSLRPPRIAPDSEYPRQIILRLVSSEYDNPPRQDAENGSRLMFTFEAELSPT